MATCFALGASAQPPVRQYSPDMVGVLTRGDVLISTDCTTATGNLSVKRRIAILLASRSLARHRYGSEISGREHDDQGGYRWAAYEDVRGEVRPVEVLDEFEALDGKKELLCVTIQEGVQTVPGVSR